MLIMTPKANTSCFALYIHHEKLLMPFKALFLLNGSVIAMRCLAELPETFEGSPNSRTQHEQDSTLLDRTRNVGVGGAGSPISFLFDDPKGDLGTTHTYTAGTPSLSVIASGFSGNNSPVDLFGKNAGSGEQGLGLVNDPQSNGGTSEREITKGSFIQLDISGLFGNITSMSAKFSFDSTTGNEEHLVYGSNTSSTLGT